MVLFKGVNISRKENAADNKAFHSDELVNKGMFMVALTLAHGIRV